MQQMEKTIETEYKQIHEQQNGTQQIMATKSMTAIWSPGLCEFEYLGKRK